MEHHAKQTRTKQARAPKWIGALDDLFCPAPVQKNFAHGIVYFARLYLCRKRNSDKDCQKGC